METEKCPICECSFRVQEKGQEKCNSCKKLYPNGLKKKKDVVINAPRITEEEIRKIVNEEIDKRYLKEETTVAEIKEEKKEEKAEFKPTKKVCKRCGKEFEATHPAQKYCDKCKETK